MIVELNDESKQRIEKVRRNEMRMEDLTLEELDGMDAILATPLEERPANPSSDSENDSTTEDGGRVANTPAGEPVANKDKSRKELFDEINRLNQTLNALPGKLKHNAAFREEFAKAHELNGILVVPRELGDEINLDDPHLTPTEKKLATQLLELTKQSKAQEQAKAQRELEDQLFGEIDSLVALNPEIAPKGNTWRGYNQQLTQAFEAVGNDGSKLSDPAVIADLASRGIVVPNDPNFIALTEIHKIKMEMRLSASDALSIWKGRNPQRVAPRQVENRPQAQVAEPDRVTNLLGSNASSQGANAPEDWNQRMAKFYAKHNGKMDYLSPKDNAEFEALLASEPKRK